MHASFHQIELITGLPADAVITVYRVGPMVDLCSGPHLPNTGHLKVGSRKHSGSRLMLVPGISWQEHSYSQHGLQSACELHVIISVEFVAVFHSDEAPCPVVHPPRLSP